MPHLHFKMATLLRTLHHVRISSNYSKYFLKLCRASNCSKATCAISALRNNLGLSVRCLATENPEIKDQRGQVNTGRRFTGAFRSVEEQQQKLDQALYRMDTEVRKTGRISVMDIQDIFSEIKSAGVASPTQCLLLIRCCGSLLPEMLPKDRIALVDDIWKTLNSLGIQLDVSHYNALLKVYLENESKFSPTDFLANMESKNIIPNRVTYQRLIGHYCQQGDMAGASKILDFMKQKDLPINENVFNSLIQGHCRANDFESARSMLGVMRNAKLEPSADTYTCLIRGYAEKGDIGGVQQVIKEAEEADAQLLDRDYLDVLVSLAVNGHSQYADEIFAKIRRLPGYNQDAMNAIYQLVNAGQDDVAYKLLLTMPRQMQSNGQPIPAGYFIIHQMIKVGRPVDKIIDVCEDLKNRSWNLTGILRAAEVALRMGNADYAVPFLKAMRDQGYALRPHYFWPILASHRKQSNEAGIYSTVRLMVSLDALPDVDTLLDYVFPAIDLGDPDSVLGKLKDLGLTVSSMLGSLVCRLLIHQRLPDAIRLIRMHPVRLVATAAIMRSLVAVYKETLDIENTVELLATISENRETGQRFDAVGHFLLSCVQPSAGVPLEAIEALLQGLTNKNLKISSASAEQLQYRIGSGSTDAIAQLLEDMCSPALDDGDGSLLMHPRAMNLEDLESHYVELKSKDMNVRGLLRRLLFQYCRVKNLKKAMEIKAELDEAKFLYTPAMYAQLMDLHVAHSMIDEALDYHAQLTKCDPGFNVDSYKILNLAMLLLENDRLEDAVAVIMEHKSAADSPVNESGLDERHDSLNGNVRRLLNVVAMKGDVDAVKRLWDVVLEGGFVVPNSIVLGPTVKVHLVRDDVDGALNQFEHCCKEYRCTPHKNELTMKLIESEDAERLQKVVELSTVVHGEMNTMYDLAFSFVDCGRIRQARKILETPGIRARPDRLDSICTRYLNDDKVEALESIVAITRDLYDVDRDQMYFYLLRAYVKLNDIDKAVGVWTAMQEENVQPSERTLIFLANFLKKHDRPVPFAIPTEIASTLKGREPMASGRQQRLTDNADWRNLRRATPSNAQASWKFMDAIRNDDADAALQAKNELEDAGERVFATNIGRLVQLLVNKGRMSEAVQVMLKHLAQEPHSLKATLRVVLNQLATMGDVAAIEEVGKYLSNEDKREVRFRNHRASAFLSGGRHLELLEDMERNLADSNDFPSGSGILGILESHPELSDRVEQLANKCAEQNMNNVVNMVWIYHFMNRNYEKANDIYQATPPLKGRLVFMSIIRKAMETKDVEMLHRLAEIVNSSNLLNRTKGTVHSNIVELHLVNGDLDAAVAAVDDAKSNGLSVADLQPTILTELESKLKAQGKTFTF